MKVFSYSNCSNIAFIRSSHIVQNTGSCEWSFINKNKLCHKCTMPGFVNLKSAEVQIFAIILAIKVYTVYLPVNMFSIQTNLFCS